MNLNNKNVVITGALRKMQRSQAYQLIINEGGTPKDNMSNIVNILVVADEKINSYTKKMRKAPADIQVISEDTFYSLVGA